MTDTKKLAEAITASGLRTEYIVKELGITPKTWYLKTAGKALFRQDEIAVLMRILNLSNLQVRKIFFAHEVDKTGTEQ